MKKSTPIETHDLESLLTEPDYTHFLQRYLAILSKTKRVSYAHITRKAGFSSRAYIREIVIGKKRLTAKALPPLASALGLSGDLQKYFIYLAASKESDIQNLYRVKPDALGKLRKKLLTQNYTRQESQNLGDRIYALPAVTQVFAALGDSNTGSTLEEIVAKIQMPRNMILETLWGLVGTGLVNLKADGHYVAQTEHVAFTELGKSEIFKKLYLENLLNTRRVAESEFESAQDLFFLSSFSVNSSRLPELKTQLRELLHRFVEESEQPDGDAVVNLVLGLHR